MITSFSARGLIFALAVVSALSIAAIALGACRKDVAHPPMKLGASVNQVAE